MTGENNPEPQHSFVESPGIQLNDAATSIKFHRIWFRLSAYVTWSLEKDCHCGLGLMVIDVEAPGEVRLDKSNMSYACKFTWLT